MQDKQSNDLFKNLFAHATPRQRLPSEAEQEIYASLHAQWQASVISRSRRHRVIWGLAASLALVFTLGGALLLQNSGSEVAPTIQVATLAKISGNDLTLTALQSQAISTPGQNSKIHGAQQLQLGDDTRVSLKLVSGGELRIDENTLVVFRNNHAVELLNGRVYFDSGHSPDEPPIYPLNAARFRLMTPYGEVQHVGTQFAVELNAQRLRIDVREGLARLSGADNTVDIKSSTRMQATLDGQHALHEIKTYGDQWAWTEKIIATREFGNPTVSDIAHWVGRQTGRQIIYASDAARKLAGNVSIIGSVDREPLHALAAGLETTDLTYELRNGAVIIDMIK